MRILSLIMILTMSLTTVSFAQNTKDTWANDPGHSQLGFHVMHMGISKIHGQFNDFNVVVKSAKEDLSDLDITVEAKVKSINTSVEMRDNHLRNADFFDVEKFPTLNFVSTSVVPDGENFAKLYGYLTIKGIKKAVELDVIHYGAYTDPQSGNRIAGFQIVGTIKRSDFGVGTGFASSIIGDDIHINGNMEFIRNK